MKKINHKKKENCSKKRNYFYLFFKLAFILLLIYGVSRFKPLIIVAIFEIIDFFKNILKQAIPYIPIDFVFILGITASYYYGFTYGLIIFILGVLNRIVMSCIEARHISKAIRHIPLFLAASFLREFNFFFVAVALLIINYILKYWFKIAVHNVELDKVPYNIVNFFGGTILFYFIYILYYYLPFLA
jgi:hypothetical protein